MTDWYKQWSPADKAWHDIQDHNAKILVIDSFISNYGVVKGRDLHWERFTSSILKLGLGYLVQDILHGFQNAVDQELSKYETVFPRIELVYTAGQTQLQLWVRSTPKIPAPKTLWIPPAADQRKTPAIKGPDLAYSQEIIQQAHQMHANEVLLYTDSGMVLEAAYASIFWWEGETLCTPPTSELRLAGVTQNRVLAAADKLGLTVQEKWLHFEEILTKSIFLTNARYGISEIEHIKILDQNLSLQPHAQTQKLKQYIIS